MSLPQGWALKDIETIQDLQGGTESRTYEGPIGASEATLALALDEIPDGWAKRSIRKRSWNSNGHGIATVNVEYATTTTGTILDPEDDDYGLISRKWSKHTNQIQTSLLAHPSVGPLYDVDAELPGNIRRAAIVYADKMECYLSGDEDCPTAPSASGLLNSAIGELTLTTDEEEVAVWLFSEFAKDRDASWDYGQPVLRKTEVVAPFSVLVASHDNVERIYTPSGFSELESTVSSAAIIAASGLSAWNWLKKSPDVEEVSGGNFQIVQEYWGVEVITPGTTMRYGDLIDGTPP